MDPEAFLHEDQITVEGLAELFEAAFVEYDRVTDTMLAVDIRPLTTFVYVDGSIDCLVYRIHWGVDEEADEDELLELANRINDSVVIVRASYATSDEGTSAFIFDQFVPFNGGISKKAIVASLRAFAEIVEYAVNIMDEDDLLE